MTDQNPRPVVLAVGHDPLDGALDHAVAEAERSGCGLHLVHVVPLLPQGVGLVVVDMADPERLGRETLDAAVSRARGRVGDGIRVTSAMGTGGLVPTIIRLAGADARLIVMQRRALGAIRRRVTRSVSSGVAARAHVPVVSVPSAWPAAAGTRVPTVTVGVDIPDRSEELLRVAASAAISRGASLHVLHTWSFPGGYDDIVMRRVDGVVWAARASADIRRALDELGDALTGIAVDIEVRHASAADALLEAGRSAELLVVGRHDPWVPFGSHLGPVARAVLHDADCPVLLVDARPGPPTSHRRSATTAEATTSSSPSHQPSRITRR